MAKEQTPFSDRIVQDPEILLGKPVIKGTKIPVHVILEYLAHNPDFDQLFADYPRLTIDDVKACFDYAQQLIEAQEEPFAVIDRMREACNDVSLQVLEQEAMRSVTYARERRRQYATGTPPHSA
jgi:uncharacterized protein (DUF433 family)